MQNKKYTVELLLNLSRDFGLEIDEVVTTQWQFFVRRNKK
jgi:hypothetical protein